MQNWRHLNQHLVFLILYFSLIILTYFYLINIFTAGLLLAEEYF